MFEVKGIPILVDEIEILETLRQQVLQRTGKEILHKMKKSGDNIMICCPIHNDGQEKKPSCGISIKKHGDKPAGTVHCFACGYVDSLEGMIAKCFGYEDYSFGTKWLLENFVQQDSFKRQNILSEDFYSMNDRTFNKPKVNYVSEEELATYRFTHSYLYKRKLTDEIIEKYDIGYQKDFVYKVIRDGKEITWKPTDVVTFPVRDINGNCLFVSRRSIYGKTFFLPQDIDKPVYGIYELPKDCKEVIICESVFNALTCVVYGRPAVALFGTGTNQQYKVLRNLPIRKYILALDPDEAGEKGVEKLKFALRNKLLSKLIIPKDKDINDLTLEEFNSLPEISV